VAYKKEHRENKVSKQKKAGLRKEEEANMISMRVCIVGITECKIRPCNSWISRQMGNVIYFQSALVA
jgi:hypothetical protein